MRASVERSDAADNMARRVSQRLYYLQGCDCAEIIDSVDARRAPMIAVSAAPRR
jgi:hypothetical protein